MSRRKRIGGEREHRLEQLRDAFPVVGESLRFGDLRIELFRIDDPDAYVDDATLLASHDELAWHPYWAWIAEGAWALADGLAARPNLEGTRVLDLGCGIGLTGAIAAARGASVLMADHAPPALRFAELNCWPWRERVRIRRLDWRSDTLDEKFDLIIGADILYDRADIPHLDRFWRRHLTRGGRVLLGDPGRSVTTEMLDELAVRGWRRSDSPATSRHAGKRLRIVELA